MRGDDGALAHTAQKISENILLRRPVIRAELVIAEALLFGYAYLLLIGGIVAALKKPLIGTAGRCSMDDSSISSAVVAVLKARERKIALCRRFQFSGRGRQLFAVPPLFAPAQGGESLIVADNAGGRLSYCARAGGSVCGSGVYFTGSFPVSHQSTGL